MSDLRIVNAKFLEERLKRGQRMNDLTDELNTTEGEMINHIKKTFHSRTAKNYIKRLKSKKPSSSSPKKKKARNDKEVKPEVMESITEVEINSTQEKESESKKTELELLLEKEDQMSNELCEDEIHHASLISQRAGLKSKLRDQYAQIKELEQKISQILSDFNANAAELNSLGDEMKELTVSITEKRNELEAHRKEIAKAKKVSMFIFANGEMEIESQCDLDFSVDTDKAHAVFNVLIQVEASENLTIKCLRTLATVSLIVEKLKFENIQYEINFDNETMQEVLNIVSQEN